MCTCYRVSTKCIKMKKARAKRAELLFFTIKYACKFRKFKGLAKLGNIVAETMFLVMFPGVAKLGNICFGRKICVREAIMFLTPGKNIFCFPSSKICFRNTGLPRG